MIIGITGPYASGKDTAASILEKQGFLHISLSDILKQYCALKNLESTRENLTKMGNSLRSQFGPGILAKLSFDGMQSGKNYVVTSIRNPAEVEQFKKAPNFTLIKLDAPLDTRFNRFKERADLKDKTITTKEEFIEREEKEKGNNPNGLQLHKVFELADTVIINDKDEKYLEEQLKKVIKQHETS